MKLILIFSLCCVAVVKGDFWNDLGREIEFDARCTVIKLAILSGGGGDPWDQFKLKLLEIQCNMGINMDPDAFLFLSYIVVLIMALFVLWIFIKILKCMCRVLTCSEPQKPTMLSIGHLPVRVISIDDPHPYNRMV